MTKSMSDSLDELCMKWFITGARFGFGSLAKDMKELNETALEFIKGEFTNADDAVVSAIAHENARYSKRQPHKATTKANRKTL